MTKDEKRVEKKVYWRVVKLAANWDEMMVENLAERLVEPMVARKVERLVGL